MKIDVFAICYNEEKLLPFFIRYYKRFARNIYIFDNYSTDDSRKIARDMGAIVNTFGNQKLDDREYIKLKNAVYKRSDADYVIVSDADEILYHPDLINQLKILKSQGVLLPGIEGYNVYSELWPREEITEIDTGFRDPNFTKQIIFSPKVDINFTFGCHKNSATGKRGGKLYMLHYRCIGGLREMTSRHRMYSLRMCDFNKVHKLGMHYFRTVEQLRAEWDANIKRAKKIVFLNHESPIHTSV
jgi:glycosyltransferase involved in cell wall biosynthesis